MRNPHYRQRSDRGFAYVEVVVSAVLIAMLLVPGLEALQSAFAADTSTIAANELNLRSKMEEVLSKPFADLYAQTYLPGGNTPTSISAVYSDAAGTPDRRVVVLYRYDALTGALSSNDTGLIYVSVYYEADGSAGALNTLVGRWW